jgi:hypothetical protein
VFRLSKWYLDLITPDGIAVICYSARVHWGPLRLRYASILVDMSAGKTEQATTLRQVERPSIDGDTVRWRSGALDVRGEWRRQQPVVRATLLRTPSGAIRWACRAPLATATIQWGDRQFRGTGYVESLGMTVSPTQLPFRTLRWGRHLSHDHSLIWIDWTGDVTRRWIWLDGVRQEGSSFSDDGTIQLGGGRRLQLRETRDLHNAPVLESIGSFLPGLASRWVGSLATLHEHKMVARSALYQDHVPQDDGWTTYEEVTC